MFQVKKAIAAVMLAATALAAFAAENVREFDVGVQPMLELSNISGDIAVVRGDGGRITVKYDKKDDSIRVLMEQNGDRVSVRVEYPEEKRNFRGGVRFEIQFPSEGELELQSVSGSIDVTGVDGYHMLKSVSGDVKVAELSGDLSLNSVSGDVEMTRVGPSEVKANSVSGSVEYRGGNLEGGPYAFNTTSGSVIVRHGLDASYRVSGNTISGSIRADLEGLHVAKQKYVNSSSLKGEYNGGAVRLSVNSISGRVSVEVE